ncbi:4Fe-4S single cluster domain-containing protein [Methylotuvimicrobium sp. KM2]|uniref:4Fe-4S single cluster domain-containing protein n=1 Tax=Methylotuvimicrobium sp. KM2 TaxID=3133976 RepID=UPI003100ACC5
MTGINVAALLPVTASLGPGRRFALWVQGCCFDCPGCIAPSWIPNIPNQMLDIDEIAGRILETPGLEGLTVSGGEPFLQAGEISTLIDTLKSVRPNFTVIVYTGFRLDYLKEEADSQRLALLQRVDVLIDGVYRQELNDGLGLRGSSNQRVHFLTDVYAELSDAFIRAPRQLELHIGDQNEIFMAGIPAKELPDQLSFLRETVA